MGEEVERVGVEKGRGERWGRRRKGWGWRRGKRKRAEGEEAGSGEGGEEERVGVKLVRRRGWG